VPAESPRVFGVLTWKVSAELPLKHTSRGEVNASRVLTTWRLVYEALKMCEQRKKYPAPFRNVLLLQMYHLKKSVSRGWVQQTLSRNRVCPPWLTGGWDSQLERSESCIKRLYRKFCNNKVLQLKIPEEIITWKSVHTALNVLKPAETILQAAATPPPLSQKQGQSGSLLKFNPTYDDIPNPTREMWEVNPPEPDDPLNPEKWKLGCKIQHPESVRQGLSAAIGVPDLRSKQGEFQHKTAQSLRCSTATAPTATALDGPANLIPG